MGVKLVFVMEGEAPKLKAETMSKRTQTRYGGFKKGSAPKCNVNTSRGRFNAILREVCCFLSSAQSRHPFVHVSKKPSSFFSSAQRCWTSWVFPGWQLLERQRPCVPFWTRRELWMAASPMTEMPFYTGLGLFTETSTWIVKYVSWRSAHLQYMKQCDHVLHFKWWMIGCAFVYNDCETNNSGFIENINQNFIFIFCGIDIFKYS